MHQINLKAKLQAYSRAPFYGDYIRQPEGQLADKYDPNVVYVLKNGSWIDLNVASSDTGLSVDELKLRIDALESSLSETINLVSCYIDYDR